MVCWNILKPMCLRSHWGINTPAPEGCWNPMSCAMRPLHKKTTWSNCSAIRRVAALETHCWYWNRGNLLISHYVSRGIIMLCVGNFKKSRTMRTMRTMRTTIGVKSHFGLFVNSHVWSVAAIDFATACGSVNALRKQSQRSATAQRSGGTWGQLVKLGCTGDHWGPSQHESMISGVKPKLWGYGALKHTHTHIWYIYIYHICPYINIYIYIKR